MPLVSIIMPSFNSESYISEAINSVINQTFSSWELIVIDDCSTDRTLSIIEKYNDDRIKIIKNKKNLGAAKSRNKGIHDAQGRYIAFLDSDDLWHKEKLSKQLRFMSKNNYQLTYSHYNKINHLGNTLKTIKCPKSVNYYELLKKNHIGCLTAIYDTNIQGKIYMPDIRKRQDYGLWLKILKKNQTAYCFNEILASYRVHQKSLSKNKIKAALYNWTIYRKIEKLSLAKSIYYFSIYSIKNIIEKIKFLNRI